MDWRRSSIPSRLPPVRCVIFPKLTPILAHQCQYLCVAIVACAGCDNHEVTCYLVPLTGSLYCPFVVPLLRQRSGSSDDGPLPPFVPFTVASLTSSATGGVATSATTAAPTITTAATRHDHRRRQSSAANNKALFPFPARRLSAATGLAHDDGDGVFGDGDGPVSALSSLANRLSLPDNRGSSGNSLLASSHHRHSYSTSSITATMASGGVSAPAPQPPKRVFVPTNKPRTVSSLVAPPSPAVGGGGGGGSGGGGAPASAASTSSYAKEMPKRNSMRRAPGASSTGVGAVGVSTPVGSAGAGSRPAVAAGSEDET